MYFLVLKFSDLGIIPSMLGLGCMIVISISVITLIGDRNRVRYLCL